MRKAIARHMIYYAICEPSNHHRFLLTQKKKKTITDSQNHRSSSSCGKLGDVSPHQTQCNSCDELTRCQSKHRFKKKKNEKRVGVICPMHTCLTEIMSSK